MSPTCRAGAVRIQAFQRAGNRVSEDAQPASLERWLVRPSGARLPHIFGGAESLPWRSQVAGESGALHSQIHFSQSTPPFLSCSPIPCEKLFLKTGTSGSLLQASSVGVGSSTWNAWVPEALPPPPPPGCELV